jgi:hypothetical protein
MSLGNAGPVPDSPSHYYYLVFPKVFFSTSTPVIFGVWDPSNLLQAEISLDLPLKLLKIVACELENDGLRFGLILQSLCG